MKIRNFKHRIERQYYRRFIKWNQYVSITVNIVPAPPMPLTLGKIFS